MSIRGSFLDAAEAARTVLADERVETTWDQPSALAHLSVRGLAGHLTRGVSSVDDYLGQGVPVGGEPVSAGAYFAAVIDTDDLSAPVHVSVRTRGEQQAAGGHRALVADFDQRIARVRDRLEKEPRDRLVRVFNDLLMRLDDYLLTRIVELVVHTDDLACSIGEDNVHLPHEAVGLAIETLVDVARVRHGDLAILRALARRERDPVQALRVL